MKFIAHATFGIFTALLVYYFTSSIVTSTIVFLVQIALILDFLFKKAIQFEPLHTVVAMLLVWLLAFLIFPAYHWFVLLAYFTHLFLDIFVKEEIPLLWPFKQELMYPIDHSENFVTIMSCTGSLVMLALIVIS